MMGEVSMSKQNRSKVWIPERERGRERERERERERGREREAEREREREREREGGREKEIFRGRWLRVCVVTHKCWDRIWWGYSMRWGQRLNVSGLQGKRLSYSLREGVSVVFVWKSVDSYFRKLSIEEVVKKFDDNFWFIKEKTSELKSDAFLKLSGVFRGVFREVEGSKILFLERLIKIESQDRNAKSTDYQCLKDFDFLAAALAKDGSVDGNVGWPKSEWFGSKIGGRLRAAATGIDDRVCLWAVTEFLLFFNRELNFES